MRLDWEPQPNGLIQGGTQWDPKRILPQIAHEPTTRTGLTHTHGALSMAGHAFSTPPLYLALAGAVSAWYMYLINPAVPAAIGRALKPVITVLENKYYLDWFNENVLAKGARGLGIGLWKGGDRGVIEGGVVNASWKLIGLISGVVRRFQTGFLYHYAFMMLVGVLLLMTWFVWLAK